MTMTTMRLKRSAAVFQAIVFASLSLHYLANAAFVQRIASPAACSAGSHTLVRLRRRLLVSPLYLKRGGTKKKQDKGSTITVNKLAFRNYEVLEKWEAGIALQGTEVKSIRDGKMNIRDGFIKPNKNGRSCTLLNVHIGKHSTAGAFFQHEERRPRELLLHKSEARKLLQKTDKMPGMTIVPLKAYWNEQNKVKFEIGLCRGKNQADKRQDIKAREDKRDINRMLKNFNDGR
ncbi:hypothetical protein ACHAWU_010143 [Discostella pseudostelligera]|uniref:SsrA-binding protein n=1 Tax=Discostella pseudostelligera TaxID=259834 RepID=A0ABD3M443_9STRA